MQNASVGRLRAQTVDPFRGLARTGLVLVRH
jgi:hypothetical protein